MTINASQAPEADLGVAVPAVALPPLDGAASARVDGGMTMASAADEPDAEPGARRSRLAQGEGRIEAFMARHGITSPQELAQVFRVTEPTARRWIKSAATTPLDQVMPGPALIVLELIEEGVVTRDLVETRRLIAVRADPRAEEGFEDEHLWRLQVPNHSRVGVMLYTPSGHSFTAHPNWFRERMDRLEALGNEAAKADDVENARRARGLLARYQAVLTKLQALPR